MSSFRMRGVVPPMITPFKENEEVDYDLLKTLVDFLKEEVDGLFITGSYGCGPLMSLEERKKVTESTVKIVKNKIQVVVMVGTTNNRDSAELARHAKDAGADAIAAVCPYYFKHTPDSVCRFFSDLITAVENDLPVYLYDNPGFQGYPISLETVKRLCCDVGVHGIKDATFDILTHATYQRLFGSIGKDIVSGTEAMWLASSVLGAKAFIPGLGNVFPEICKKMFNETESGEFEKAKDTQFKINRIREIMYKASSTQMGVYAMLKIRGIISSYPRSPFINASQKETEAIRNELENLGLLD